MNLEEVKHKMSASYERINNMKVAISRVESCKSMLMLRRDEVLADVKIMMNEIAQQLLNLQMCIEATVNSTVEERAKYLDAKKQDILNANSYLVEVCMDADRLLKGRNEDLLGRACQRIFSRFERAWQQLDMAGTIDARSMVSLVFKSNMQKFSTSTYIARLQQLDQHQRVLDEQEFWVDDPSHSFLSESPVADGTLEQPCDAVKNLSKSKAHTFRKSSEQTWSSGLRCTLETIQEMPETMAASPKRECVPIAEKRNSVQKIGGHTAHHKQLSGKEPGQKAQKRLPSIVRIREIDLFIGGVQDPLENAGSVGAGHGRMLLPQGFASMTGDNWEDDLIQMDNMNMRSLMNQESDTSQSSVNHMSDLDVSGDSGASKAAIQSDLEFWKVDSLLDESNVLLSISGQESFYQESPELLASTSLASNVPYEHSAGTPGVSTFADQPACTEGRLPSKSPDLSKEEDNFLWEEDDFLWESDEEASPVDRTEGSFVAETADPAIQPAHVSSRAAQPGPTGDSQKSLDEASSLVAESSSSKNIALCSIHQHISDKTHTAGQSDLLAGGDPSGPSSSSAAAKDVINIVVGVPLAPTRPSDQLENVVIEELDQIQKEPESPNSLMDTNHQRTEERPDNEQNTDRNHIARAWSLNTVKTHPDDKQVENETLCSNQSAHSANQAVARVAEVAQMAGVTKTAEKVASALTDIQRPLKTIRTKRLDISRMLEHTGNGLFECPAKLIEQLSGDLRYPIGIATNSVGDAIVGDTGNNLIRVFRNGTLINTFGEKLARPSAVVVNEKDEIFVKDDNCMTHYDRDGQLIKKFGRRFMHAPYGIGMVRDGNLVVLDTLWQNPRLLIFSQDGTMTDFPFEPLLNAPPESKCRFLAVCGNTVLTSDLGCSHLYLTSLTGQFLHTISQWGQRPGELNEPSGIAVDSAGNWIVADSKNNRIQVFAPNGYYLCKLRLSEPIRRPSGIHLSRDGLLYVINYLDAHIKVYKVGVA